MHDNHIFIKSIMKAAINSPEKMTDHFSGVINRNSVQIYNSNLSGGPTMENGKRYFSL